MKASSSFGYLVSATQVDPEDPEAFELVGFRKTMLGAQGLARRTLGKKLQMSFCVIAGTASSPDYEVKSSQTTRKCRIQRGWG